FFSSRRRHTISKRDWSSDVCSSDQFHHDQNQLASECPLIPMHPTHGQSPLIEDIYADTSFEPHLKQQSLVSSFPIHQVSHCAQHDKDVISSFPKRTLFPFLYLLRAD